MNHSTIHHVLAILMFVILSTYTVHAADAAGTMSLDPASASTPVGQTITVKVLINTGTDSATSADVVLKFNSQILSVSSITNGINGENGFFPDFFQNVSGDEIYIGSAVINPTDSRTGSGTLATIVFSGKSQGISDLTFDCTSGKTSDTNISKNDKNATDIVDCAALVKGQYSVGSGIAPTAAATPTRSPAAPTAIPGTTNTPTPTSIRVPLTPGSTQTTLAFMSVGIVLLIGSIGSSALLKFMKS